MNFVSNVVVPALIGGGLGIIWEYVRDRRQTRKERRDAMEKVFATTSGCPHCGAPIFIQQSEFKTPKAMYICDCRIVMMYAPDATTPFYPHIPTPRERWSMADVLAREINRSSTLPEIIPNVSVGVDNTWRTPSSYFEQALRRDAERILGRRNPW